MLHKYKEFDQGDQFTHYSSLIWSTTTITTTYPIPPEQDMVWKIHSGFPKKDHNVPCNLYMLWKIHALYGLNMRYLSFKYTLIVEHLMLVLDHNLFQKRRTFN